MRTARVMQAAASLQIDDFSSSALQLHNPPMKGQTAATAAAAAGLCEEDGHM